MNLLTVMSIPWLGIAILCTDAFATTQEERFTVKSLACEGARQATGSFVLHQGTQGLSMHSRGTSGSAPEPAAMYMLQAMLSTPTTKILETKSRPGRLQDLGNLRRRWKRSPPDL